jgi:hypothetical protein
MYSFVSVMSLKNIVPTFIDFTCGSQYLGTKEDQTIGIIDQLPTSASMKFQAVKSEGT